MTALSMYRGDDREFTLTLTEDGAPMDLTGATLRFTAKHSAGDADVDAVVAKETGAGIVIDADPETGIAVVTVDAADTTSLGGFTRLVYDVEVTRGGSTRTVLAGRLDVLVDVSGTSP
jgi:hypothetical protein